MTVLWETGDIVTAVKLNKSFNSGVDSAKETPTVIGEAYLATDTSPLKVYVSADGVDWTHYFLLTAI